MIYSLAAKFGVHEFIISHRRYSGKNFRLRHVQKLNINRSVSARFAYKNILLKTHPQSPLGGGGTHKTHRIITTWVCVRREIRVFPMNWNVFRVCFANAQENHCANLQIRTFTIHKNRLFARPQKESQNHNEHSPTCARVTATSGLIWLCRRSKNTYVHVLAAGRSKLHIHECFPWPFSSSSLSDCACCFSAVVRDRKRDSITWFVCPLFRRCLCVRWRN